MDAPNASVRLVKYQALGNDYLVLDRPAELEQLLPLIPRLCDRHLGVGADGLLAFEPATLTVRIFNPDGSEAERSGNGLRIAACHAVLEHGAGEVLNLRTKTGEAPVRILATGAGWVECELDLGVPVVGKPERLQPPGVEVVSVGLGNPHCVVFGQPVTPERCREIGPVLESHKHFPERTNVQLVEVRDRSNVRIEIWERGAGYTLASGTSAAAAAAACMAMGLVDGAVRVRMPGGALGVRRTAEGGLLQTGPASRVFEAAVDFETLATPAC